MGLKEELEEFRGGGNNGGHGAEIEGEQGSIFVGETDEGVVDERVQEVEVSHEGEAWLWAWRVGKVAEGL